MVVMGFFQDFQLIQCKYCHVLVIMVIVRGLHRISALEYRTTRAKLPLTSWVYFSNTDLFAFIMMLYVGYYNYSTSPIIYEMYCSIRCFCCNFKPISSVIQISSIFHELSLYGIPYKYIILSYFIYLLVHITTSSYSSVDTTK